MRVLVVEDEIKMASLIRRGLRNEGLSADVAITGEDALWMAAATAYDAIVLDVMLPGMDGFETCRRLRTDGIWSPVIMLTARDAVEDRVAGLDEGADDYLTKPFSPRELVARVRAVLRRAEPAPPEGPVLEVGELRVDLQRRRATLAGSVLVLRTLEFELLAELARNPGHVVTRDRLLDRVWGVSFAGGTRTVDVHVAQLRKKLGRPGLIQTVRGVGYRLLDERT
jgi:two-component system, OmpR family, response regulator